VRPAPRLFAMSSAWMLETAPRLHGELLLDRRFRLAEGIAEGIRADLFACVMLDDVAPQSELVVVRTHRIDELRVTAGVVVEHHEIRRHGEGRDLDSFVEGAREPVPLGFGQ
jgi:hypothetical protein